jgi:hypothetical protein
MVVPRFFALSKNERLLADFSQGKPPSGQHLTLLCEDQNGKYRLPFPCEWRDGAWYRVERSGPLTVRVIGWRPHVAPDAIDLHSAKTSKRK